MPSPGYLGADLPKVPDESYPVETITTVSQDNWVMPSGVWQQGRGVSQLSVVVDKSTMGGGGPGCPAPKIRND